MARMPGAVWKPLASNYASQGRLQADIVCIHTMVGSLLGTDSFFRSGNGAGFSGTESHFGTGPYGEIIQWQDTAYRADANLDGNDDIISIENADFGAGFPRWNTNDGGAVPAFTAAQCEAIAKILAWAHRTHGIPLVLIPDSKPGRRGIAYHRMGVDPYRVAGGEKWSLAYGKVCPGARRIAQIPGIIARARQLVGLSGAAPAGDDGVPYFDLPSGHYYGLSSGPDESHGGYYAAERDNIAYLQKRLVALGWLASGSYRSGYFEDSTKKAVSNWQHKDMPGTEFYGQVWSDDWRKLFSSSASKNPTTLPAQPAPPKEDDMPTTKEIVTALLSADVSDVNGGTQRLDRVLTQAWLNSRTIVAQQEAFGAALKALAQVVADGEGFDPLEVEQAVISAVDKAMANLEVRVERPDEAEAPAEPSQP